MNQLTGLLLVSVAISMAITACFSETYFYLMDLHPVALNYLNGDITTKQTMALIIDQFSLTEYEMSHLSDVKNLLYINSLFLYTALPLLVILCYFRKNYLRSIASWGIGIFSSIIVIITICYYTFGWKVLTSTIHNLVFPAGNWRFSINDLLIKLYPREVMQTGAISLLLITAVILTTLFIISNLIAKPPNYGRLANRF